MAAVSGCNGVYKNQAEAHAGGLGRVQGCRHAGDVILRELRAVVGDDDRKPLLRALDADRDPRICGACRGEGVDGILHEVV